MKHSCTTKTITLKVNERELGFIVRALSSRERHVREELNCPNCANLYATLLREAQEAEQEFSNQPAK